MSISAEYILEETGRNTAAAVYFAALASNPDDILCITPSDHWINDDSYYCNLIESEYLKLVKVSGHLLN